MLAIAATAVVSAARVVGDRTLSAEPPDWFGVPGEEVPVRWTGNDGSYRFAVIGDIQRGQAAFTRSLEAIRDDDRFSFAAVCGDLVNRKSEAHYRVLFRTAGQTDPHAPVLTVPGNHDDTRLYERYLGPAFWTARIGPDLLIGIDTSEFGSPVPYYDRIRAALRSAKARHVIAFVHRPLGRPERVREKFRDLYAILVEGGVTAVFAGHLHHFEMFTLDGVLHATNGPGGYLTESRRSHPSLAVVTVRETGVAVEALDLGECDETGSVIRTGLVTRIAEPLSHPLLRAGVITVLLFLLAGIGFSAVGRIAAPLALAALLPIAGLSPPLSLLVAAVAGIVLLRPRRDLLIPLLFAAVLIPLRLSAPMDLKSNDQAKSAQYSLSTWETGEWLVPLEAGKHLPTKPPLAAWAGVFGFAVAGEPSEIALRVVAAIEALFLLMMTVLIARRLLPEPGPLVAGLVLAANYIFVKTGTSFRPDALLAGLVALAVWLWIVAFDERRPGLGVLAFGVLGLATLTKGPVALIFGLAAILPWALIVRRSELRSLGAPLGVPLFLVVVAAWAVPAFLEGGRDLFDVMVTGEISHHAGPGRQPIYTYLYAFPTRFLPWIAILPFGIAFAVRQWGEEDRWPLGLPLLWFAVVFVVMSLFGSKRADYLLPVLPAAAILTAAVFRRAWIAMALAGVFLLCTGIAFHLFSQDLCEPTAARDFARRIREETDLADRVHVHRMGSYRNAVLFHLGRTGPPSNRETVFADVQRKHRAFVATTGKEQWNLEATGIVIRQVLATEGPDDMAFVLLELTPRR